MTEHAPPVPPDDLRARWFMDCASGEKFNTRRHADKAAAWGWEQAMQEREELAGIIDELLQFTHECLMHGDVIPVDEPGEETFSDFLARARAAAERLRGGES
jgi:hypothetical protein